MHLTFIIDSKFDSSDYGETNDLLVEFKTLLAVSTADFVTTVAPRVRPRCRQVLGLFSLLTRSMMCEGLAYSWLSLVASNPVVVWSRPITQNALVRAF